MPVLTTPYFFPVAVPPVVEGHRYWSVQCTGTPTSGDWAIYEIEMHSSVGGTDLCTGGTAIDDYHYGSFGPANAFDNVMSSGWVTDNADKYVGYDFGAPVAIVEYKMGVASGHVLEGPKNWKFRWSDNGTAWTTVDTVTAFDWNTVWDSGTGNFLLTKPVAATTSGDPYFPNVSALLHFDGVDASTSFPDATGRVWTRFGDAQVDTAQSVFGGASMLCDGNGDYIECASTTAFGFTSSADYTIEFRVRFAAISRQIFICSNSASYYYFDFGKATTGRLSYVEQGMSVGSIESTTTFAINTWYTVAVTRASGMTRLFINGVPEANWPSTGSTGAGGTFQIGCCPAVGGAALGLNGWLDEFRFTSGMARYATNYTPATVAFPDIVTPVPPSTYDVLMHFDGLDDSIMYAEVHGKKVAPIASGDKLATEAKKFGVSSFDMSSGGSGLRVPTTASAVTDFSMGAWVYLSASATNRTIVTFDNPPTSFQFHADATSHLCFTVDNKPAKTVIATSTATISAGWHFAMVERANTTVTLTLDGVVVASGAMSTSITGVTNVHIGAKYDGTDKWVGYLDDVFFKANGTLYNAVGFVPAPTGQLIDSGTPPYKGESWSLAPFDQYNAWAIQLGVSTTGSDETLAGNMDDNSHIIATAASPVAGMLSSALLSTEGGIWFGYEAAPGGNTAISLPGVSRMHYRESANGPSLGITFHPSVDMGLSTATRVRKSGTTTIIYGEWDQYSFGNTNRVQAAIRLDGTNWQIVAKSFEGGPVPVAVWVRQGAASYGTSFVEPLISGGAVKRISNWAAPAFVQPAVTLNPNDKFASLVLSNGNLTAERGVSGNASQSVRATFGRTAGRYAVEFYMDLINDTTSSIGLAPVVNSDLGTYLGAENVEVGYRADGNQYSTGTSGTSAPYATGDRILMCVDFGARRVWFYKNGTLVGPGDPATGQGGNTYTVTGNVSIYPGVSVAGTSKITARFSAASIVTPIPGGFYDYDATTLTPATDANFASVVALLHFEGAPGAATFTDVKGGTWTGAGGITLSGESAPFGTTAAYFDGTDDAITSNSYAGVQFGTGDFTIECFMMCLNGSDNYQTLVQPNDTQVEALVAIGSGGTVRGGMYRNGLFGGGTGYEALGLWRHVAYSRQGGVGRVFHNGIKGPTDTADTVNYTASGVSRLGTPSSALQKFKGYIKEVRITKGVARYTENFAPPIMAFPDAAPVAPPPTLTWNPSDKNPNITLSNSNRSATVTSGGTSSSVRGSVSKSTGKWLFEITAQQTGSWLIGIANASLNLASPPGTGPGSYAYHAGNGNSYSAASSAAYGATYTAGDVIGVALDLTAHTITFYKNGVSQGVVGVTIPADTYFPITGNGSASGLLCDLNATIQYPVAGYSTWV